MTRIIVRIFHREPAADAGPLERSLAGTRLALAHRHLDGFRAAGADLVEVTAGQPDDTPFGARVRAVVAAERPGGLIVLGSGAIPLASQADRRRFVDAARDGEPVALANSRYSADVVAVACAERLLELPDLDADNALPRWLEEVGGYVVRDLRDRWRLQVDLDSPLDALLIAGRGRAGREGAVTAPSGSSRRVAGALRDLAAVAADRRAELVVAGRTSAATLRWLERNVAARVRALVEERGLRAASRLAHAAPRVEPRPPRSILGLLLDRDGPEALGERLRELGDAALVDTRVLLAHRLGPDERRWPPPEDRFASDLLRPESIADPWLRALTVAAAAAPIPIVLGGHTLVGPGLRLALRGRAS